MKENLGRLLTVVPAIWPVDLNTGANPGDYVSMKCYQTAGVNITINTAGGTCVVTMKQATAVAGTGEKALSFTRAYCTGVKLKVDNRVGVFTVGEVVNGAGGAQGTVYKDLGTEILLYTVNATAFVDNETVTGATSGSTASADGIGMDEDILLPFAVASNTFTIPAVATRKYYIPVSSEMLDRANGYDCFRVHLAQASGAAIGSADYILSDCSYPGEPMPTAIYD